MILELSKIQNWLKVKSFTLRKLCQKQNRQLYKWKLDRFKIMNLNGEENLALQKRL